MLNRVVKKHRGTGKPNLYGAGQLDYDESGPKSAVSENLLFMASGDCPRLSAVMKLSVAVI